ncbi:hypothetical protein [Indioceanicola profundi]|uniref:hypothetical protein n=1 Tax=Indioceanicola profundi TaxID=2220096 RepID=UPI000E6A970E|nr:hypothetical protein [Indioceanicola profundi]
MAEDNIDQAREMAEEGARKLKQGDPQGRELIEEAKRLDHDAVADIAPESADVNRGRDNAVPHPPASTTSHLVTDPTRRGES